MKNHFKEIWTNDLVLQATKAAIDAENIPEGSNIIADSLSFLGKYKKCVDSMSCFPH